MKDKLTKVFNQKNVSITGKVIMTVVTAIMLLVFFRTPKMYQEQQINIAIALFLAALELVIVYVKNPMSDKINAIATIVFAVISIPALYALLDYSQGFDILRLKFFDLKYNLFIIFAIFAFFYLITNSIRFSVLLNNIILCVIGLTNYYLIKFRGTGLLASDLYNTGTAMNVAGNYNYDLNFNCFVLVFVTIIIGTFAFKLKRFTPFKKVKRLIPFVCSIIVISLFVGKVLINSQYDKTWKIKMFKPQVSYDRHGSILMFAHSFRYLIIEKPEEYSVEKVKEIAANYSGVAATTDKKPNIIVIMDEAFSDLSAIGDVEMSEDCMPFFHSLKENTIKGNLFVSVCAGGTANTEFEVLTSNALAFAPLTTSPYQIYINDPMPSLATTLKQQNYGGITAMHPYKGNGYKRNKVYPLLGFNNFLTRDDFDQKNVETIRRFISDEADFDRIIEEFEEYRKTTKDPYFMFNVTMQNHSAYDTEWTNLEEKIKITSENKSKKASMYVNLIKESDDALKGLLKYFETVDEPTIIVFFGDHQARLGKKYYKELLKTSPLDDEYNDLKNFFTPFIIWANYDIEEKEDVWTSPNYLTSMILDTAGLAKTGYQQYVSEVQQEVPVLTQLGYIGKDGKFYKNGDKKSPYYNKLREYQVLEYNNLFDAKNRIDKFFDVNK